MDLDIVRKDVGLLNSAKGNRKFVLFSIKTWSYKDDLFFFEIIFWNLYWRVLAVRENQQNIILRVFNNIITELFKD